MIGKGDAKILGGMSRMAPADQRQHTRTAANMLAQACRCRLLGTRNPELLHTELQRRTFHSKPDCRAFRSAEDPVGVSENR